MARNTEPKVKLRGDTYYFSFTVKGHRFRGTTGERDHGRAQSVLAAKWYEETRGTRQAAGGPLARMSLAELAGQWLAEVEARGQEHGPQYVARHKLDVGYILRHFAAASDVTNDAWQTAMRALNADGLSWRSLQHATVTLRHLMRFAAGVGAIGSVPELKPPANKLVAKNAAPRRALTDVERDRVLKALCALGHTRAARIWLVMAYTGLRKSELAKLSLRWIEPGPGLIRVPATAAKSGEEETIPLLPLVRQAVRAEAGKLKDRDKPVFGGFDMRKSWRAALTRAKVDNYGLTPHHSARHTFGTLVAQLSGGDVTAVQAAGRWRSLAMVAKYVHANAARARAAMKRL